MINMIINHLTLPKLKHLGSLDHINMEIVRWSATFHTLMLLGYLKHFHVDVVMWSSTFPCWCCYVIVNICMFLFLDHEHSITNTFNRSLFIYTLRTYIDHILQHIWLNHVKVQNSHMFNVCQTTILDSHLSEWMLFCWNRMQDRPHLAQNESTYKTYFHLE